MGRKSHVRPTNDRATHAFTPSGGGHVAGDRRRVGP